MNRYDMTRMAMAAMLALLIVACNPMGEGCSITSYTYAEKDGQTLQLDVYLDSAALRQQSRPPVFIFCFGGGWETGERSDGRDILADFAHHGYVAVGIDYRLGIRMQKDEGLSIDSASFAKAYSNAIMMGVEDLCDATQYVIDHAHEWDADTSRIVVSGSSAGATNVLTTEYLLCRGDERVAQRLPEGFNYAAVVPFAGGVWLKDIDTLCWDRKPCPVLAYHGIDDPLVPYGKVILHGGTFGAFGPDYYVPQLREMGVSYLKNTYAKGGHFIAGMDRNAEVRNEVREMLGKVFEEAPFQIQNNR